MSTTIFFPAGSKDLLTFGRDSDCRPVKLLDSFGAGKEAHVEAAPDVSLIADDEEEDEELWLDTDDELEEEPLEDELEEDSDLPLSTETSGVLTINIFLFMLT